MTKIEKNDRGERRINYDKDMRYAEKKEFKKVYTKRV